jgi:hypothetical protein
LKKLEEGKNEVKMEIKHKGRLRRWKEAEGIRDQIMLWRANTLKWEKWEKGPLGFKAFLGGGEGTGDPPLPGGNGL